LPVDMRNIETPEWEKETWTGSQIGPDGFYHHGASRGGLRRGSSGGQVHPPVQATSPQSSIGDPYGHTKKTRTKPIRNSDGVLIRKDGRPDMRSQSSAANLRKVHARKEEEKQMGTTPTSGLAHALVTGSRSPVSRGSSETEMTSTQERTNHIMNKMFPHGVQEQQGRLYTSEQYFPSAGHSPPESKSLIARSEGSGESEEQPQGLRDASKGDGDERIVDRPMTDTPQTIDTMQTHTLEASVPSSITVGAE